MPCECHYWFAICAKAASALTDGRPPRPGRAYRALRCERCGLRRRPEEDLPCACTAWRPLPSALRISIVAHFRELRKPSNTARLALGLLPLSRVLVRGGPNEQAGREVEQHLEALHPERCVLLFPSDDATDLDVLATAGGIEELVVPDGTWAQARRLVKRYPALQRLRAARLPAQSTEYRLRRGAEPGLLCTAEAIAAALGILEGPDVAAAMKEALLKWQTRAMKERTGVA